MERTLDMKFIRYLNLFEKVAKIRCQHCFVYNSIIIFLVPRPLMARAIGESGKNVKKLSEILEKKVKIIAIPDGMGEIGKFIMDIVHPVKFKSLEVREGMVVITAGMQSKAALIGRDKKRLEEMREILGQYFNMRDLRII